jgi:hypothetical protein
MGARQVKLRVWEIRKGFNKVGTKKVYVDGNSCSV